MNLCLGTDSLATTRKTGKQKPVLDMFAEMRALMAADNSVSPKTIVQMATVNGARALGLAGQIGGLSPQAHADLIAIPLPGGKLRLHEAVLAHSGSVAASMIDGCWMIPPPS